MTDLKSKDQYGDKGKEMEETTTISKAHGFELLKNTLGRLKMSSDFYGDYLGTKISDDSAKMIRADFKLKNTGVSKRKSNIPDEQPLLVTGGILKQYQLDGFEWMATLWENGINGILADETGLDKTTQVIALFCHMYEMRIPGPFLVISPLSNVSHWITELERLAPDVPCLMYHGNKQERMKMRRKIIEKTRVDEVDVDMLHVVVTSYDVAVEDTAFFSNIMWRNIVLEEGPGFKNIFSRLIQELQLFNSSSRLFLDCGIIWNALIQPDNLSQLSSLLNWILPDIFDDLYLQTFQSWFGAIEMSANVDELHEQWNCILATLCQIFTPFLLRRKRRILTGIRRIKSKVDPDNSPMKEVKSNQNLENNPEEKTQQESHLIDQEVQRMRSATMSSPNPKNSPTKQVKDKVINMSMSGVENKYEDNAEMQSTVFVAEPPTRAEVEALNETRSSSSLVSLMNGMKLGKCSGESQNETGKVQERDRAVDSEKVAFAMECANCRKQIKKAKLSLVCLCKLEVYCTSKCQQSSSHKLICKGAHKPTVAKINVTNGGPSGEKVKALLVDIGGSPQELKMKAENGDPIAAYIIGSAFSKRRTCNRNACKESEKCPTMMPQEYLDKSILETDEIAIKWLEVAAKGGVPEAMFDLGMKLQSHTGLRTDRRAGHDWLVAAYGTGKMDNVMEALQSREFGGALGGEFLSFCDNWKSRRVDKNYMLFEAPNLALFLLATRLRELKEGVTATGEPLLVFHQIKDFLDDVGELKQKQESEPLMLYSEKKRITMGFCAARPGSSYFLKDRNEKNVEFVLGHETHQNPDYQLLVKIYFDNPAGRLLQYMKTTYNDRTPHLISCKHMEDGRVVAGGCKQCVLQAGERLRAVGHGVYSISLTEIIPNYGYAARYATEDGVIMQDFFKGYSKSEMRQVLQCLMSKPRDLHPLAVAENQNLFWPIVWYWGSVFNAIKDSCGQTTLETIYHKLEHKFSFFKMDTPISAQAAFPMAADGERRIACGSETCPNLDHEVKFSLCRACKVRRYCGEDCQREDWPKHKVFCRKKRNV